MSQSKDINSLQLMMPTMVAKPASSKEVPSSLSDEEVERIGKEKYEKEFAPELDTAENRGKFFVLDILTGDYEVEEDLIRLTNTMVARHPDTKFYLKRIGYDYIDRFI